MRRVLAARVSTWVKEYTLKPEGSPHDNALRVVVGQFRDCLDELDEADYRALCHQIAAVVTGGPFALDDWIWCSRCQRAYQLAAARIYREGSQPRLTCGFEGCDSLPVDWHGWAADELPRCVHPAYPVVPERFGQYPLHGASARRPADHEPSGPSTRLRPGY